MKVSARDFAKLRWALIAAVIAVGAAAALIIWGLAFEKRAVQEHDASTARHRQIDHKLRQVRNEEEEIRAKSALFLQLQEAGVFGEERRLQWSELLTELQRELRLPGLEYEFSPQTPLENHPVGGYAFFKSRMNLHLHLLHEEDFFHFLHGLETRASALVLTRACQFERLKAEDIQRQDSLAQLSVRCEIDWITARPPVGP